MSRREKWIDPRGWAGVKPFGIGEDRPNNYGEIAKALLENRDRAGYAWRILHQGTCDGCALGTKGMRDWTMREIHLCNVRLRLLRLNTMPALDGTALSDVGGLGRRTSAELREMGCGYGQGFLLARPMAASDMEAMFRAEPKPGVPAA